MQYQAVIGLEIHIQLNTHSKLFSSSPTTFGQAQNSNTNEIDLGFPGVLPVLNEQAVKDAILFGKAIGAHINQEAYFMRKNYFYPDLPKGYQISQLDDAIIQGGVLHLKVSGADKAVRVNRGQLEEDAGKSVHDLFSNKTGIDLNRAGVPLIELVSEPDMHSAQEAVAYMRKIHHLVRYLGISDGNMQEGSFRCDANVSVREMGTDVLNNRVELKNINSFRFVEQAINLEIERQIELLEKGQTVAQETRLFDAERMETRTMRTKEEANDYRYFPDPDLLPLDLSDDFVQTVANTLPELPDKRYARYATDYQLNAEIIDFLLETRVIADYFESLLSKGLPAHLCANWLQNELVKEVEGSVQSLDDIKVSSDELATLLGYVHEQKISGNVAKKILREMWADGLSADTIIERDNLMQSNDTSEIEAWVDAVLAENPKQIEAYKAGQEKMLGFFVGQVLKRSQGKANPQLVNQVIREKLS